MQNFQKWPIKHPDRIQLFSLPTPNGQKISVALEELELPYEAHRVDIGAGDQFLEEFKKLSPNSKIPAIIDPNGPGGRPLTLMESGAILQYLAEKTDKLLPRDPAEKFEYLQWLYFQVGHIGPMFGQFGHFHRYAREKCDHPYPIERYQTESKRLLMILEKRLSESAYVGGPLFSIVDIAIYPWVDGLSVFYKADQELALESFPRVAEWLKWCKARPSWARGAKVCA